MSITKQMSTQSAMVSSVLSYELKAILMGSMNTFQQAVIMITKSQFSLNELACPMNQSNSLKDFQQSFTYTTGLKLLIRCCTDAFASFGAKVDSPAVPGSSRILLLLDLCLFDCEDSFLEESRDLGFFRGESSSKLEFVECFSSVFVGWSFKYDGVLSFV